MNYFFLKNEFQDCFLYQRKKEGMKKGYEAKGLFHTIWTLFGMNSSIPLLFNFILH